MGAKRVFVGLLLAVMSTGAIAEWVRALDTDHSDHYVDLSTIRKNGKMVKMWDMTDHREPTSNGRAPFSSEVAQVEYDCGEERSRLLALTRYSGHMGRGKVVFSASPPDPASWSPARPGSVGHGMLKIACGEAVPK